MIVRRGLTRSLESSLAERAIAVIAIVLQDRDVRRADALDNFPDDGRLA